MFPFPDGNFDPAKSYAISGQLLNRIYSALRARTPVAGANIILEDSNAGFKIHSTATGGGASGPCAFGEIIDFGEGGKAILGGMVYCNPENFEVPPYEIDLGTDGEFRIYLELDCEASRDDDNEIFLPGIADTSETTPSTFWNSTAGSYPANTPPVLSTGIGTIIIPLGVLTVDTGAATFIPTDCGNVTINHCAGTISHARG